MAEWERIRMHGLRGEVIPEGGSQLVFPGSVDTSQAEVVIQVDQRKCAKHGYHIFETPPSGFYIDKPDGMIVLTPEFFLDVWSAAGPLPIPSDESRSDSSGIVETTETPSQLPTGFYFQHMLPPELRRKKTPSSRLEKRTGP